MAVPMLPDPFGGRDIAEWVGKTPNSPVPERVQNRVLKRYGDRCYLSGRPITPGVKWEVEHIRALSLGGSNRETNLAPAIKEEHKPKTKAEKRLKSKADRVRRANLGLKTKKSRPMPGSKASGWKRTMDGRTIKR